MAQVLVRRGVHAGREHNDIMLTMVRGLSSGQNGLFITVDGTGVAGFPQRNFRMHVNGMDDFEVMGEDAHLFKPSTPGLGSGMAGMMGASSPLSNLSHFTPEDPADTDESDEDITRRINERFEILGNMTHEIARGALKGLVVYGAPGTGKSHGVEYALQRDSLADKLAYDPNVPGNDPKREERVWVNGEWKTSFKPRYKIIRGNITANGLYKTLFEYQDARDVLVFDDTDVVLQNEDCLTFLKVALDTTEKRILHWISTSNRSDALPNSFEFKGSVIFITNLNFERIIAANFSKLSPHLEAIMSRCLYLDLTIETTREKLLRINHVARECGMLKKAGLEDEQIEEVLEFTHANAARFRELSLRKVLQLADIRKMKYENWRRVAEVTVLKGAR